MVCNAPMERPPVSPVGYCRRPGSYHSVGWRYSEPLQVAEEVGRDVDLFVADQYGRLGGFAHRVVGHPVVAVPVGGHDLMHVAYLGDGFQQGLLVERHINQQRVASAGIMEKIRVIAVRTHWSDL